MKWASKKGHLGIIKFLYHNRTEGDLTEALSLAHHFGNQKIVEFLTSVIETEGGRE